MAATLTAEEQQGTPSPQHSSRPPIVRTLLALLLTGLGQAYFHFKLPLLDGALLYLLGLAFFWSALGKVSQPTPLRVEAAPPQRSSPLPRWGWVAGAASLCLLGYSLSATVRTSSPLPVQATTLAAAGVWIAFGLALDRRGLPGLEALKRAGAWLATGHGMILVFLLALAALLRLIGLGELPEGLWYDEANIGLEGRRILTDPGFRPLYAYGTTTPAAYVYLVALAEAVWGQTVLAVRATSAYAGIATVALSYVVGRQLFGPSMGLAATALLAFSRWDISFSRIGMQGATTPAFFLLECALLLWALRSGSRTAYAALGVAIGGSFWFYTANFLFPLVLLAPVAFLLVTERDNLRSHLPGAVLALGGIALVFAPVLLDTWLRPSTALSRPQAVSVFQDNDLISTLPIIQESARKHLLMFHVEGDGNGRHNLPWAPMLDGVTGVLAALGFVAALRSWWDPRAILLLVWLPLLLLPGILTLAFEAPQALRSIGTLPAILLLATWGLERLRPMLGGLVRGSRLLIWSGVGALLVLLLNAGTYWGPQRMSAQSWSDFSMAQSIIGRHMAKEPAESTFLVSNFYQNHPTIAFLTDRSAQTFEQTQHLPLQTATRTTLFLAPEEQSSFLLLKQYYPDAPCTEVRHNPTSSVVLYTCTVSPTDVERTLGWSVRFLQERDGVFQAISTVTMSSPELSRPATLAPGDYLVEATSSLYVSTQGEYRFALEGADGFQLLIDEKRVAADASPSPPIDLTQGLHQVRLLGSQVAAPTPLRISWQPPGQSWQPLPGRAMFQDTVRPMGLTAAYTPGSAQATSVIRRVEAAPSVYYHIPPLERPFSVEWSGSLFIQKPGSYRFFLEAISSAQLELDGQFVVAATRPNVQEQRELALTPGWRRIKVRYQANDSYAHVYLHWQPPGEGIQLVPPQALRPW